MSLKLISRVAGLVFAGDKPLEELLSDPDEVELYGLRWSGKNSTVYRKGQTVRTLDRSGYHDSEVVVVSTQVIVDEDGQKYLAVKQKGHSGVVTEELDRKGYILGDMDKA